MPRRASHRDAGHLGANQVADQQHAVALLKQVTDPLMNSLPGQVQIWYAHCVATALPGEGALHADSKAQAVSGASAEIAHTAATCSHTPFALIGNSQGADAAGDLARLPHRSAHQVVQIPSSRTPHPATDERPRPDPLVTHLRQVISPDSATQVAAVLRGLTPDAILAQVDSYQAFITSHVHVSYVIDGQGNTATQWLSQLFRDHFADAPA